MGKDRVDTIHRNDDLSERQRRKLVDDFFKQPEAELRTEYDRCLLAVKALELKSYSNGGFRERYEDVTQDAALAIFQGDRKWDPRRCSFVSAVYGVAKSMMSNGARDGKRRSELNEKLDQDTSVQDHAEDILEARETEQMLRKLFAQLKREYPEGLEFLKIAIPSRLYGRMEDQEIAKEMGLSKSAFSRLQSKVLDKVGRLRRTGRQETYQAGDEIQRVPGEKNDKS